MTQIRQLFFEMVQIALRNRIKLSEILSAERVHWGQVIGSAALHIEETVHLR